MTSTPESSDAFSQAITGSQPAVVSSTNSPSQNRLFGFDWPYLMAEWKDMFKKETMVADLWAGATVALVALPLNLALAIAAGVEPGVGITTGIIAGIIAGMFGGQRYAITGPAAAMAVVLIEISQRFGIQAVWFVGIIAGLMQMISGMLRLGRLIAFIPMPVIVGFANAIGILVIANSIDDFLGLPTKKIAHASAPLAEATVSFIPEFIQDMITIVQRVIMHQEANIQAIAIGLVVLSLAVLVPKWTKVVPGQLVSIVVASVIAWLLGFDLPRIIDISHVPTSLPMPQIPTLPWKEINELFPAAITVFMLGSIESLLSASVADGMTMSKRHHSDQELVGQGLANVLVPFFGGIPVTGVIARTAVNIRAGARTRLSAIVHSIILMILAFSLAKFAEQIPLAALGGILILTGTRLVEWDATRQIWRASRTEGYVVLVTTAISVLIDLTAGVFTGLMLTCGLFIKQMSAVKILPEEDRTDRRATVRQPLATCKFVRTFLIDGPLFFGAAERFTETILLTQNLKAVVLHMRAVSVMDMTGAETLLSINAQLKRNGVRLVLAELPAQPLDMVRRTGVLTTLGAENFFKEYKDAILDVNIKLLETSCLSCAAALTPDMEKKPTPPKDCKLHSAITLDTNRMASLIKQKMKQSNKGPNTEEINPLEINRLVRVATSEDIPVVLRETPVEELLKCQNLMEVDESPSSRADLIIGMCMDYRKQLHLPKNCAYILRAAGANMRDSEFSIGMAVSVGIEYMALICHNQCLMSNPYEKREGFCDSMVNGQGWQREQAEAYFDNNAGKRAIDDAIDFAMAESQRLQNLYPGLKVVPMMYLVDNDKIYLIREWVDQFPVPVKEEEPTPA